jgi:hypothetical protein
MDKILKEWKYTKDGLYYCRVYFSRFLVRIDDCDDNDIQIDIQLKNKNMWLPTIRVTETKLDEALKEINEFLSNI